MKLYTFLNFVKNNFINILVLILVSVIFLQKCNKKDIATVPTIVRDTVWVKTSNTVITKPTLIKSIPEIPGKEFIPDPNYIKLVEQYQNLVKQYISNNVFKDSIKIDSLGYVQITDTVSKNLLIGRKTFYNFKYPIITNTITLPPINKTQLYYGGGIEVNPILSTTAINLGLLLKTKKDNIYNIYGGVDTRGTYQIGLQSYWKISFKTHK